MKKLLLQYVLLLLPAFAISQNNPSIYKDFTPKIKSIGRSFQLDNHTAVLQTNIDDKNFELVAVNDKMEVLWRTTLKGYVISAGKFKGQILAVAASEYSEAKRLVSPISAFLLNGQTGKLLLQKVIYNSPAETQELARGNFSEDGSGFTLAIRQTGTGKSASAFAKDKYEETKDFTLVNLDDKLNAAILKIKIPANEFENFTFNKKGDLFVFMSQGNNTINVLKYEAGKTEPSGSIVANAAFSTRIDIDDDSGILASLTDPNVIYFASIEKNAANDKELSVCKLDFNSQKWLAASEVFTKKHLKSIENSYIPFDKKFDKPDLGITLGLKVKYINEHNGTTVVTLSDEDYVNKGYSDYIEENALVINGYDIDLKPKFQQVIPCLYEYPHFLYEGYHFINNILYLTANTGKGKLETFYGQLDLINGNWLKLEKLSRGGIEKYEYADKNILWFANGFIIPYMGPRGIVAGKEVAKLQLNIY